MSVAAGSGCARASVAPAAAATTAVRSEDFGTITRHPDAVALLPAAAIPAAAEVVAAQGLVTLREPVDERRVTALVESFFRAWQSNSLESLVALLARDAGPLEARGRGRVALTETFRQRLQSYDYTRLSGVELVIPERIERWSWDELGAPGGPSRPPDMMPGELYVRAPLEATRVGGERVFGDVAILVLRREGRELRIAAYGESAAP